ncbi:MAG TPA: type II CAAX endopeptidase family protein [Tepidisphaeraceae bacterium]|nr:type II CAAX endopeptidase family protein [Tepidisphaeraceae bacterium]
MSILGADANFNFVVFAVVVMAVTLGVPAWIAGALRVFRARTVVGPERLSRRQSPWPLVAAVGMGLMMWVMVQALYGDLRKLPAKPPGHSAPPAESVIKVMTPGDWAFVATVPPLAGFTMLWLADFFVGGTVLLDRLGFSLRRSLPGIAMGILAAIVILPPTYFFSEATELLYQHIHYVHPLEHELLKVMKQPENPVIQWILVFGAAVVAPLWEEFLFRGHIQTLLKRGLVTLSSPRLPGMEGFAGYAPMNVPINPNPIPFAEIVDPPPVWQTWLAIVLTSVLFAMMHPMWMRPPIFILSLGLGYCYERTGNLWTNMTVHCLFNSVSTFVYLFVMHP